MAWMNYNEMTPKIVKTNQKMIFIVINHVQHQSNSFHWPKHQDVCWVPSDYILCVIDSPNLPTTRGQYTFSSQTLNIIDAK